jgi:hypothetical protein
MHDPANDVALRTYADRLVSLAWGSWQVIHERAEIRRAPGVLMSELTAAVGAADALVGASIADMAGTAVNSLVIAYFVKAAEAAYAVDERLAKTWLDILDRHEHSGHTGTVLMGTWGVLFRSTWGPQARQRCWEPFAWDVPYEIFGLEPDR